MKIKLGVRMREMGEVTMSNEMWKWKHDLSAIHILEH